MRKNGFSIIEIIVVVAIISILSAIVYFNFAEIRQNLALNRAAHQFIQSIRRAQEMAMSTTDIDTCESASLHFAQEGELGGSEWMVPGFPPPKGFGIYVDIDDCSYNPPSCYSNELSYILYADTSNGGFLCGSYIYSTFDVSDCKVETVTIAEQDVYINGINNLSTYMPDCSENPAVSPNKTSINFIPPNPDTRIENISTGAAEIEVIFGLKSNDSKTKKVTINRAGIAEIE